MNPTRFLPTVLPKPPVRGANQDSPRKSGRVHSLNAVGRRSRRSRGRQTGERKRRRPEGGDRRRSLRRGRLEPRGEVLGGVREAPAQQAAKSAAAAGVHPLG